MFPNGNILKKNKKKNPSNTENIAVKSAIFEQNMYLLIFPLKFCVEYKMQDFAQMRSLRAEHSLRIFVCSGSRTSINGIFQELSKSRPLLELKGRGKSRIVLLYTHKFRYILAYSVMLYVDVNFLMFIQQGNYTF